jgi:hypothetical protein
MKINEEKLVQNLLNSDLRNTLDEDLNATVEKAVENATEHPLNTDKWIYRIVVLTFGISLLTMVIFLSVNMGDQELKVPDVFVSIISAIVGAIAGLLAPSPIKSE